MADIATRLVDRVRRRVRSLEGCGRGVVAAVSGGPDSVALLRALVAARDPAAPFPVVVAHLNHQLRGAESDADEAFATDLHARLATAGVPALALHVGRIDVAAQARADGANLEATARRVRYAWLAETAREAGALWVATGHTADDQAETVLHRLLRGTGLQGLRGIAAQRELAPGLGLVRPLLQTTRAEIIAYLNLLGQPFRVDSTNSDLKYTRNRIRSELLPHLTACYNPAVARVLARLAEQAEEAYRDEEAVAVSLLSAAELPRAGATLVFDRARLAAAPRRLTRAALRLAWAREGWPLDAMNYDAWERLAGLVYGEGPRRGPAGRRPRPGPRACLATRPVGGIVRRVPPRRPRAQTPQLTRPRSQTPVWERESAKLRFASRSGAILSVRGPDGQFQRLVVAPHREREFLVRGQRLPQRPAERVELVEGRPARVDLLVADRGDHVAGPQARGGERLVLGHGLDPHAVCVRRRLDARLGRVEKSDEAERNGVSRADNALFFAAVGKFDLAGADEHAAGHGRASDLATDDDDAVA